MKFYSQYGQDKYVLNKLDYRRDGFFVDVGAGHPTNISNTYYMENELGWTGLLIEANDYFVKLLNEQRISPVVQTVIFDESDKIVDYVNIGTCDGGYGDHINGPGLEMGTIIKHNQRATSTLQKVLEEHNAPKIVDYMSLDIEGVELQALKSIDLNQYQFRIMTVENSDGTNEIIDYLYPYGYILDHSLYYGHELVIVHKDLI